MYQLDQRLLRRFAEWLLAQQPTHAAAQLLRAVDSKSPVIGAHLKSAIDNAPLHGFHDRMTAAFSVDECAAILAPLGASPSEVRWEASPTATRQRRRSTALDAVARQHGFETWRRLETAVINGDVTLRIE